MALPALHIVDITMKMSLKNIVKALLVTTFSGAMLMSTAHANNPPPTIKADAPNRYIVKKGDTLWDIANENLPEKYSSTEEYVKVLKEINGLSSDKIYSGENLMIMYMTE